MAKVDTADGALDLFEEFALAEAKLQQAKDAMKPIKQRLLGLFPSDPGEYEMVDGRWKCTVKVPDRVKWNSDDLAAYYGTSLPPYVKRALSMTETDYKRLPAHERDELAKAREIVAGTPVIDLEVVK